MFYYYEFIIFLLLLVFCPLELLIIVDVIQCTGLNVGEHAVTPVTVGVFRQMLARLKLKKKTKNEESRIEISLDRLNEIAFSLSITSCYTRLCCYSYLK